jgi:predicted TIM-barrel fold metal-dependent hydrolase
MIVDALVLLGESRFGRGLAPGDLLRTADRLGIDRVVAAAARPMDYHLGPANDAVASTASSSDGRVAALGRVDPSDGDRAVDEAHRCLVDLACRGLFIHPFEESTPVTSARAIFEVAAEHGRPLVVATGHPLVSEPLQVAQIAMDHPTTPVVMTNAGNINISGLSLSDAWLALSLAPNLHVTTNGEYRQDFIERLANDLDPGRVMFASMTPVFDQDYELRRVRSARMSRLARTAMEGEAAATLFALGAS